MKQQTAIADTSELAREVDILLEEVRALAVRLALYLAQSKQKSGAAFLNSLEPEFVELVSSAVRLVSEVGVILNAARNLESLVYEVPSGGMDENRLENKLRDLLGQCSSVLSSLVSGAGLPT